VRLARLGLEAALAVPDVLSGEAGVHGLRVTADPPAGLLRGVSVTAEAAGSYAVDLRLVVRMVPLVALGDEVRRRVRGSARRAGLDAALGAVNVEFAHLVGPDEADSALAPAEPDLPPIETADTPLRKSAP